MTTTKNAPKIDLFTQDYLEAALWTSWSRDENDDAGRPLDQTHSIADLAPEALARAVADCKAFQEAHAEHIGDLREDSGHALWLTRNDYEDGFLTGAWPEPSATILNTAARALGGIDLLVGDDGKLYFADEEARPKGWDEIEADEDPADEPEDGDLTTEDHVHFYQHGKLVLTVREGEDMADAVAGYMSRTQFWPNVWFVSDHGNAHRIAIA